MELLSSVLCVVWPFGNNALLIYRHRRTQMTIKIASNNNNNNFIRESKEDYWTKWSENVLAVRPPLGYNIFETKILTLKCFHFLRWKGTDSVSSHFYLDLKFMLLFVYYVCVCVRVCACLCLNCLFFKNYQQLIKCKYLIVHLVTDS